MKDKELPTKQSTWSGYTLEELRYEKVVALARIQIEKAKLIDVAESTRESLPIIGNSSASGIFKSISRFEYLILAIKLYRKIRPLFKRKN